MDETCSAALQHVDARIDAELTPDETARTIALYRRLLRGEVSGTDLWRELKLQNQLGVTRGQMEKAENKG